MAKKGTSTSTGKVSISYVNLHKELKALSKRVKEVKKLRPHSAKLKKVESKMLALMKATECQKIMVIDL
jgi:hypothetical protein